MTHPTKADLIRLRDRLRELEAGAEPQDRERGICRDIAGRISGSVAYWLTKNCFGGEDYPLGKDEFNEPGDHWSGERGTKRRALCGQAAREIEVRFLMENVK